MAEEMQNSQTEQTETQAEEKVEVAQETPKEQPQKEETPKETPKTFTQEEVDKMIQSMTDKRVTEALKTAQGKWESEYQVKLEAEKKEAERLAKLSAKERQEEELKKMQQAIDIERAEFEKQRDDFKREKIALATVKELGAKGLPTEFVDFLVSADEETTKANLETFETKWNTLLQESIEKHVQERLQAKVEPKQAQKAEPKVMTKKEFANLPYSERQKMMNENPDFVKAILAQK